jgi:DNA helicase MCM9
MSEGARELISTYYQFQRAQKNRNLARTTVRLLESLRRLSEGHARLMFRNEVIIYDVINAISLLEVSMQSSAIVGSTNSLHIAFPSDPMEEYRNQVRQYK